MEQVAFCWRCVSAVSVQRGQVALVFPCRSAHSETRVARRDAQRVAFDWAPFVVPVPSVSRLLRLLKTEDICHEASACGFGAIDRVLPGFQSPAPRSHAGKTLIGFHTLVTRVSIFQMPTPSRKETSARNRGFNHLGADDFSAQIICLQLHQQIVGCGPPSTFSSILRESRSMARKMSTFCNAIASAWRARC